MRILTDWLAEFTDIPEDIEDLAHRLTDIGLEVDEVIELDRRLERVMVVETLEVKRHPKRPDLKICEISNGTQQEQVVTAAPGVLPNRHYLWAAPGGKLGAEKIEKIDFAGVESAGMLCSSREIGLTEEAHTLLEIPDSFSPGTDAVKALELQHPLLEVDLTPNRPDCLSHLGVARDFAAAEKLDLKDPRPAELPEGPETEAKIKIDDPDGCWAYTGVPVKNITVGPSSFAIQKRILKMGLRPLNNIVDITNYTLFEVGHPLHPFDADKLEYPIIVRRSKKNERLTTLDDEERKLRSEDLVIADRKNPVALAGIMGGSPTQVTRSTTNLLLEGAYFEPSIIRRSSNRHKLHTEASHRFERGVDPENYNRCLARCIELLETDPHQGEEFTVCRAAEGRERNRPEIQISFSSDGFKKLIGYNPGQQTAVETFKRLGMDIVEKKETLEVSPPSWRKDLTREEDLIEEIVRLNGYEEIPTEFPDINLAHTPCRENKTKENIIRFLTARGFTENITFSFVGGDQHRFSARKNPRELSNPLSNNQATMRQSILDGLLESLRKNIAGGRENIRIFELGRIYPPDSKEEPLHLGLMARGMLERESWDDTNRQFDFYDLKGLIFALLEYLGHKNHEIIPADNPGFVRNRCGTIIVDNREIGPVGEIATGNDSDDYPVLGAQLNISAPEPAEEPVYSSYSTTPTVKRDLDLVLKIDQPVGPVKKTIRKTGSWLEKITIFDYYRGEPLAGDEKSVSFNLEFRRENKTLSDSEVNEVQEKILTALRKKYGARLREK